MWRGKKFYLIGAGKSGLTAARWLLGQGARVCLNDRKAPEEFSAESWAELLTLEKQGLTLALDSGPEPVKWDADCVLASPGVALSLPGIREALDRGVTVTNEVELGWQVSRARIVGVTGSNGKTTVTGLIGHMMRGAGPAPFVGGNIGTPFLAAAPDLRKTDWAVLELSSFQLESMLSLAPEVAVILNLTPDHLDRHKTFANYAAAKWNIARCQDTRHRLILNYDDPLLREEGLRRLARGEAWLPGEKSGESGVESERNGEKSRGGGRSGWGGKSAVEAESREAAGERTAPNAPGSVKGPGILWFSRREEIGPGAFVRDGRIMFRPSRENTAEEVFLMPAAEFPLAGLHNLENLLAALCAGMALGIAPETLRRSAGKFQAIEHRMEPVAEEGGVLYVNDSKATNPDSAIKALEAYDRPVLLIAGGDGKGAPFRELAEKIKERSRLAVLIGRDGGEIGAALLDAGFDAIRRAESLEAAVALCRGRARPGDVVLLSPACASYDMFDNYEERGRAFKAAVRALLRGGGGTRAERADAAKAVNAADAADTVNATDVADTADTVNAAYAAEARNAQVKE